MNFIRKFIFLTNKKFDYVFFSEGRYYQTYFDEFIKLIAKNINNDLIYLSSDKNDVINEKNIRNIYIGNGFLRLFYLSVIKCKYFFMTLTDLNNHNIRRSKNIEKYVYIFHAANSTHRAYTKKAFNNYDIILCPGIKHEEEIKKTENLYKLKKKKLVRSGYFFLDKIINLNLKQNNKILTILVAPSWNYKNTNFVNDYLEQLLFNLLSANKYKVIFRPHPETLKREKKIIDIIKNKYSSNKSFSIDLDKENLISLQKSDLLITDYSGIAIEYIIGLKKPTIFFSKYKKVHNSDYKLISEKTLEDEVKEKFGLSIEDPKFEKINSYIEQALVNHANNQNDIDFFLKKNFFNIGQSSTLTAKLFINQKL